MTLEGSLGELPQGEAGPPVRGHQQDPVLQRQTPRPVPADRVRTLPPRRGDQLRDWRGPSPVKGAVQEGSDAAINTALGVVGQRIENVVNAVHARAPQARVLLVSYSTLLPDNGGCTGVPLTADQRVFERTVAVRLAQAYIDAANDTGATLVRLATASHGHDACAADPWVEKYKPASGRTTYHPNEAGMKAAASLGVESALG